MAVNWAAVSRAIGLGCLKQISLGCKFFLRLCSVTAFTTHANTETAHEGFHVVGADGALQNPRATEHEPHHVLLRSMWPEIHCIKMHNPVARPNLALIVWHGPAQTVQHWNIGTPVPRLAFHIIVHLVDDGLDGLVLVLG